MGRADTDGDTVDEAADDEHGDVLRSTGDDGADDPDDGANLDSSFASKLVGEIAREKGTTERTTRHGRGDTTLDVSRGTRATIRIVGVGGPFIEVAAVLLGGKTADG